MKNYPLFIASANVLGTLSFPLLSLATHREEVIDQRDQNRGVLVSPSF